MRKSVQVIETADSLEIRSYPEIRWVERIFGFVWGSGWTFFCVFLLYAAIFEPEKLSLGQIFFVAFILFIMWGGLFFVAYMLLNRNFRFEVIRIDPEAFRQEIRIKIFGVPLWIKKRRLTLSEAGLAKPFYNANEYAITLSTSGKPIRILRFHYDWNNIRKCSKKINTRLKALGVDQKEVLNKATASKFRWKIDENRFGTVFQRKGRVPFKMWGAFLLVSVIWNGLAFPFFGIGLYACVTVGPVGLAIFCVLITTPHVLVGLFFMTHTVLALLQCICRYELAFESNGIRYSKTWIGIGFKKFWQRHQIKKVEIKRSQGNLRTIDFLRNPEFVDGNTGWTNLYPFSVLLKGENENPIGKIPDLSQDEAQRIAVEIRTWINKKP